MHPMEPSASTAIPKVRDSVNVEAAFGYTPSGDCPYSLFAPVHYEKGYAYPLIVWLHGHGGNENQLIRVMPEISLRNFVGISVQGTEPVEKADGQISEGSYTWDCSEMGSLLARQRIMSAIETAQERFHIHPNRIMLVGYDRGGTTALRVALSEPTRFAGVASICGGLPQGRTPLKHLVEARKLPILFLIARTCRQYTQARLHDDLMLMFTAGMSISLREYPGNDLLRREMLSEVDRWGMEQIMSGRCSS